MVTNPSTNNTNYNNNTIFIERRNAVKWRQQRATNRARRSLTLLMWPSQRRLHCAKPATKLSLNLKMNKSMGDRSRKWEGRRGRGVLLSVTHTIHFTFNALQYAIASSHHTAIVRLPNWASCRQLGYFLKLSTAKKRAHFRQLVERPAAKLKRRAIGELGLLFTY